jgi:hypothetical protein
VLLAILHLKRDKSVDKFLELIQRGFARTMMWGNVGGIIGEQMVRAAFAPLIRFSSLAQDFKELCD